MPVCSLDRSDVENGTLHGQQMARCLSMTTDPQRLCLPAAGRVVALVGTDIEGSTALYEWSQDLMQEAQDIHDNLLRSELRYEGH